MEEELIKYDTAVLAKEKGFDIIQPKCFVYDIELPMWYDALNDDNRIECFVPTQSLLQKWLREVHKIDIWIDDWNEQYGFHLTKGDKNNEYESFMFNEPIGTYEQAIEKGLQEALKLI